MEAATVRSNANSKHVSDFHQNGTLMMVLELLVGQSAQKRAYWQEQRKLERSVMFLTGDKLKPHDVYGSKNHRRTLVFGEVRL